MQPTHVLRAERGAHHTSDIPSEGTLHGMETFLRDEQISSYLSARELKHIPCPPQGLLGNSAAPEIMPGPRSPREKGRHSDNTHPVCLDYEFKISLDLISKQEVKGLGTWLSW